MQSSLTREEWLDYIRLLIVRVKEEQRTTGITAWALMGVIAILILKIVPFIPELTRDTKSAHLFITSVIGTMNISFSALFIFWFIFALLIDSNEKRLQAQLVRESVPTLMFPFIAILILLGLANLYVGLNPFFPINYVPFFLMAAFFLLIGIRYPYKVLITYLKHKEYHKDLPELATTKLIGKGKTWEYISSLSELLMRLGISIIPAYQGFTYIRKPIHIEALHFAFYCSAIVGLILIGSYIASQTPFSRFLVGLERRIMLDELDEESIRNEFIRKYVGEDISDWLIREKGNIENFLHNLSESSLKSKHAFNEISNIDPDHEYELEGRTEEICSSFRQDYKSYYSSLRNFVDKINYLKDQDTSAPDTDLVLGIINEMFDEIKEVPKIVYEVCDACKLSTKIQQKVKSCGWPSELEVSTSNRLKSS